MDGGAWRATVHRVAKSRTRLSDFTSLHLQRRDGDADVENGLVTQRGRERGGQMEKVASRYIHYRV